MFATPIADGDIEGAVMNVGEPKTIDFLLERNTVSAGFGDDLSQLLQLSTIYFDYNKYNIRKDSEIPFGKN